MSRIERVVRELSDLRDFYFRLQKRHAENTSVDSGLVVAEEASDYSPEVTSKDKPWFSPES